MLIATENARVNPLLLEMGVNTRLHLADDLATIAAHLAHCFLKHTEAERIKVTQPQILQFLAQMIHAEPTGNRGVNFQGFAGNAPS